MSGHGEELRAAIVRPAERKERIAAAAHDPRHRGEGLGVVDRGRLAVEAVARGKRRLEARKAFLALERLEERGFLAADIGAVAGNRIELVAELRAEDVLAHIPGVVGFLQRLLELLVGFPDFAVDVVVAGARAHCITRDHHTLDHQVRVVAQEIAVLAGAGLAFVRIAHHVLRALELSRHERPLEPGREAGAAAAAKRGFLEIRNDVFRGNLLAQELL